MTGDGKIFKHLRKAYRLLERGFEKATVTEMYAWGAISRDELLARLEEIDKRNER